MFAMEKPTGKTRALSIRQVAKEAGVSVATISRVINNESAGVSDETRSRVQKLVRDLDYSPNKIGRALRAQTTDTFALVISNIQNSLYAAIAWELESQLNDLGKVMLLFNTNENAQLQDRSFEEINTRHVSGLFVLCAVESRLLRSTVAQTPTVFINRKMDALSGTSFVGIDDYAAAGELAGLIFRNLDGPLAVIHGPLYSSTSASRLRGLADALKERGLTIDPADIREARLAMDSGYQCAADLLGRTPYRSIYCGNDQIAYGAYRRCRELSLRVPDDIRIYGFDDNPMNEWLAPWLNTVRVPHVSFAVEALRQMRDVLDGGSHRSVILPYEIIVRA